MALDVRSSIKNGGGLIEAVEHRWVPEEDTKQGFEIVDSISGMFLLFTNLPPLTKTKSENCVWTSPRIMGSLIPEGYKGAVLPLWRFKLQPSLPDRKPE